MPSGPGLFGDDDAEPEPAAKTKKPPTITEEPQPSPRDVRYFAYGSNLSVDRKAERTGAIREAIPARLAGYRLAFNKRASRKNEAYANIVPDRRSEVWGVCYLCSPEAMKQVDHVEGTASGHYEQQTVEVTTRTGKTIEAIAYVAGPDQLVEGAHPADEYLRLILDGARQHALPEEYIQQIEALARPTEQRPTPSPTRPSSLAPHPSEPAPSRPTPMDEHETDDIMAAFRQATRGRGAMSRDVLLKEVSVSLGYQRLGPKIEEALRGHLRAAIRRRIIETEGPDLVRSGTATMTDYDLEELRECFRSVMRKGTRYEREEVIGSLARYLGFVRITDTIRQPLKSAITSAIRHGLLGYDGSLIWRAG